MNNKILFHDKFDKFKNESLKQYFQKLFSLKLLIWKLIAFLIIATIIVTSSFVARHIVLNNFSNSVKYNVGVSFGIAGNTNNLIVFIIQIIPCIISFIFILLSTDKLLIVGFCGIFFGGLCNIIDRAITIIPTGQINAGQHAVVDYIPFIRTVINIPDIFITSSAIVLGLGCVLLIVKIAKTPDNDLVKKEKINHNNEINDGNKISQ